MAAVILVALVWTARGLAPIDPGSRPARRLASTATVILVLLVLQIALGGLVAGLKAGHVYDTWPLIDGAFIPVRERLLFLDPPWLNFLDNHLTVQFMHRMVAYLLVGVVLLHAADGARCASGLPRVGAIALVAAVMIQVILGVVTLLWHVPLSLALAHQCVAMLVLILTAIHARNLFAARVTVLGSEALRDPVAAERLRTI